MDEFWEASKVNSLLEQFKNKRDHQSCLTLTKKMRNVVKEPFTEKRQINSFFPKSYNTTCAEFRDFMDCVNKNQSQVRIQVGNMLLDKKVGVETTNTSVTHIDPKVGYDNIVFTLV